MAWWWLANAVLFLVVIPVVVVLAHRVLRGALLVKRHAEELAGVQSRSPR